MHHQQPTIVQKRAIEARLNMLLGAQVYDSLFLGFECGDIIDGIAHVYAQTEYFATRIDAVYEQQVALAVESVMKHRVKGVNVIPKDFADYPPLR
jgi:hypothetical protein